MLDSGAKAGDGMGQTVLLRDGYVVVQFFENVDRESARGALQNAPGATDAIAQSLRVLFDFSEVTSFKFDPLTLAEGMKRLAERGVKLAVCSSNPEFFGIGRQVAQYSGLEGEAISVFRTEPEALGWLLGKAE